jgi:class 3 adenylate cyclase
MKETALVLPRNALLYRDELVKGRVSHGYVAFSDIKGFTSLTEGLKALGKEGAEITATKIDELILPVACAAVRHGGNVIAVEGDAILASFESREGLFSFCAATREFAKRRIDTPVGSFDVSLDIGIAGGMIYELVAGTDDRRAYVVAGGAIDRAYEMERLSDADVVADSPYAEAERTERDGVAGYRLNLAGLGPTYVEENAFSADRYALSFMPQPVREGTFNEFLPVTAAFCDFDLIGRLVESGSLSRACDAINELFSQTTRIVELAGGGMIDKFKGYNSLLVFGAPLVHADDSRRAVEAMSALRDAADRIARKSGLGGEYGKQGLNKGTVFAGEICGRYSVIGDAVNTAARIKEAGNGDLYISGSVLGEIGDAECRDRGELQLRGKSEKARAYSFIAFAEERKEGYVLRKKELEELKGKAAASIMERGMFINVIGDVGSGKDKLLSRVAESLAKDGVDAIEVRPTPIHRTDPYRTVIEMLKKAGGYVSDAELLEALGAEASGESEILGLMGRKLLSKPRVFVISAGDNVDPESLEFLGSLRGRAGGANVSVMVSCSSKAFAEGEEMVLHDLDNEESVEFARYLAKRIHGTMRFGGDTLSSICTKSRGNPLFISELVKSAKSSPDGLFIDGNIPAKLEQLLLSNVSRMPMAQKLAMKLFSLMYELDWRALEAVGMRRQAEALIAAGILTEDLEFNNDLLRKVVADQIPALDKKDYYTRIAVACDAVGGDDLTLSYYYSNADTSMPAVRAKAVHYLDRYVKGLGDLSVVRIASLEKITQLADRRDERERRICVEAMMGICKFRHVNATKKQDYREYFHIARDAARLSKGTEYEYKAMLEMGRALCWLQKPRKGFGLMRRSRQAALEAGDIGFYGTVSSIYGYALSYTAGRAAEAIPMLKETEEVLVAHLRESGDIDRESGYNLSSLYFALAEAHNRNGDPRSALDYLKKARYYSDQFGVHHIFVQALGTMGEAYYKLGEYALAEEHCLVAERAMDGRMVQMRHFRAELYRLLAMIYEKKGETDKMAVFRNLAESV